VIQDSILEPDKTAPKWGALFALNMLVGTDAGSSYSGVEYAEWMNAAGFREVRRVRLPGPAMLPASSARLPTTMNCSYGIRLAPARRGRPGAGTLDQTRAEAWRGVN